MPTDRWTRGALAFVIAQSAASCGGADDPATIANAPSASSAPIPSTASSLSAKASADVPDPSATPLATVMLGGKVEIHLTLPAGKVPYATSDLPIVLRTLVQGHRYSTGDGITPFIDTSRREIVGFMQGDTGGKDSGGMIYRCPIVGAAACTETALHLPETDHCDRSRSAVIDVAATRVFVAESTLRHIGDDDEDTVRLVRCPLDGTACAPPTNLARNRARSPQAGLTKKSCSAKRFSIREAGGRVFVTGATSAFSCDPDAMKCAPITPDATSRTDIKTSEPSVDVMACDAEGHVCGETIVHAPEDLSINVASAVASKDEQHIFISAFSSDKHITNYIRCKGAGCSSLALSPRLDAVQFPKVDSKGGVWAVASSETDDGHGEPSRIIHCLPGAPARCVVLKPLPDLPLPWSRVETLFFEGRAHLLFIDDTTLGLVDASFAI